MQMIVNLTPRRKKRKRISIIVETHVSIISLLLLFPILEVKLQYAKLAWGQRKSDHLKLIDG